MSYRDLIRWAAEAYREFKAWPADAPESEKAKSRDRFVGRYRAALLRASTAGEMDLLMGSSEFDLSPATEKARRGLSRKEGRKRAYLLAIEKKAAV